MFPSRHSSLLSPTPSEDSSALATVPSTIPISVVTSSPVPTSSVQSPQAPPIGTPGVLLIQFETAEDYLFVSEMRSMATIVGANATATVSRDNSEEPSEVLIPLEG